MAVLNFPNSPSTNDQYIENNVIYTWTGNFWRSNSAQDFDARYLNISGDTMTGALGVVAGGASAPGVFFSGDTNTGLLAPAADSVAITTGGTQRIVVDSSGNVGIGTSAAQTQLHVVEDGAFSAITASSNVTTTGLASRFVLGNSVGTSRFTINMKGGGGEEAYLGSEGNFPIYFQTHGTERLRIDSSGNVFIGGTTASSADIALNANGSATFAGEISSGTSSASLFTRNYSGGSPNIVGAFRAQHEGSDKAVIFTDGSATFASNVGIGTTSAAYQLDVQGSGNSRIRVKNTSVTGEAQFHHDGNGDLAIKNSVSGRSINFFNTGSERMRIDSAGRLLVGGSSSSNLIRLGQKFAVSTTSDYGGGSFTGFNGTTADEGPIIDIQRSRGTTTVGTAVATNDRLGSIVFRGDNGTDFADAAYILGEVDGTPSGGFVPGRFTFYTGTGSAAPTERMRLDSSGNILIGSSSQIGTGGKFQITSSADTAIFRTTSTTTYAAVVVNVQNTAARLLAFQAGNTTNVGTITTNGSSTSYNTSSDHRLKENVVNIADGITRVKQLQPKRFNFIADADTTVDGFLAHEAQTVVPEAVSGSKDEVDDKGNPVYQGIDQSKLVPLLTAALQEALAKIETLEQRLSDAGIA